MNAVDLEAVDRKYIGCLNERDWEHLDEFVHEEVQHNGKPLGVGGYRTMLQSDYAQIPDLRFEVELLVAQSPWMACRLRFNCAPKGDFLGIAVNGRRVTFCENVFYGFDDGKSERSGPSSTSLRSKRSCRPERRRIGKALWAIAVASGR